MSNDVNGSVSSDVSTTGEESTVEDTSTEEGGDESSVEASSETPSTEGELKEAVQEAVANGASKKEVEKMISKFSLKVNGKTIEKEFDLSDKVAMQKELQMAAAGREAMQVKAEYEKALNTLVTRLKEDPLALAEELGLDADEMAALRLQKKLDEAKKSPEQIEFEKMQKEIEAYRRKEQERDSQLKEAEARKIQEDAIKELDEEIEQALNAYTSLPKGSPIVMDLIAKNLNWAMDNFDKFGFDKPEDVRVEHILPSVEKDLTKYMNKFFEDIPMDLYNKYLGNKASENMRQQRIKSAKKVNNISNVEKTTATQTAEKKVDGPKISLKDFMRSAY